jgi:hypothetical protein
MAKAKHKEPPLESARELAFLKEKGPVVVTRRKRGFLVDIHVSDTSKTRWKPPFRPDGRQALLALTRQLREHLDARGLPTDKWPITPIEQDFGYDPKAHGIIADEDIWFECAVDTTEPLTKDRLSAELLHASNRALARFNEDELRDVYRLMYLHHLYATAGELNELAIAEQASKKRRKRGPEVKHEKAQELRELILATAKEFWRRHPRLVAQPFNTAKKIVDMVNKARKAQNPGCKPLAVNTVYNHLRLALGEA